MVKDQLLSDTEQQHKTVLSVLFTESWFLTQSKSESFKAAKQMKAPPLAAMTFSSSDFYLDERTKDQRLRCLPRCVGKT
jgi:hypothetical protein